MPDRSPFPVPVRMGPSAATSQRPLELRIEKTVTPLRSWLPRVHVVMFLFFVTLILGPVLLPANALTGQLARSANWLIWGVWFPLVFLSVLVVGRSWCGMLCPMGAASEWVSRIGWKRRVPIWLRWEGTPIVSFVLITILGQTVGVRDYPDAIAEVFGGTLLAALAIGFVYGQGRKARAWCRHACPIGLLLGVFARLGMVDLAPKRQRAGGDAYVEKGLCPTMIDINRKTESRHCIMCLRCVQPGRRGGLALRLRAPGAEVAAIDRHHPSTSELWLLFLGTGVALGGFLWLVLPAYQSLRQTLGVWAIDHGWNWVGRPGPAWLMVVHPEAHEVFVWLDFLLIVSWMLGLMVMLAGVLAALNAAAVWAAGRFGARGERRERFIALGYQFAPVAMVSLLLGLGGDLFALLSVSRATALKVGLLVAALVWSAWLGRRILAAQGVRGWRAYVALGPGLAGAVIVAAVWWPVLGA